MQTFTFVMDKVSVHFVTYSMYNAYRMLEDIVGESAKEWQFKRH